MTRNTQSSTTTIRVVCAIVFLTFVFSYVYCYQSDVLALAQHVWSGGETHYDSIIGAVLITIVLYIIHLGVCAIVRLPHRAFALSFAPSLILLGVLSSATIQPDSSVSVLFATVVACVLMGIVAFAMKLLSDYAPCESKLHGGTSLFSQVACYNYGLLATLFFVTFCMGNNDRHMHSVLRMEHSIIDGHYGSALDVAANEGDASMTMLRAYALSKQNELGERLFEYPLSGGSRALLPARGNRTMLMPDSLFWRNIGGYPRMEVQNTRSFLRVLQKQNMARPCVDDYMLTACLLDRDLSGFAREIVKVYDFRTQQEKDEELADIEKKRRKLARMIGEQAAIDSIKPTEMISPSGVRLKSLDELPKHYREALVLYTHSRSHRELVYVNNAMDTDYAEFQKILRTKHKTKAEHDNALKTAYFGTYWWYYYKKS
jgi:hypothetical protein